MKPAGSDAIAGWIRVSMAPEGVRAVYATMKFAAAERT